jgi:putative hemolysin
VEGTAAMVLFYIIIFVVLVFFSAFFSSAETSLLALNKIKLGHKTKKKDKKAMLLSRILQKPEEFFSTILIGNNFVNIAAASISTMVFTHLLDAHEEVILLVSTVATTIIILLFAEIVPKSYAFRYSERMSYIYAYPLKFFGYLFYPFVKATSLFSSLVLKEEQPEAGEKELTMEEIKHFLSSHMKTFKYNPEALRMLNEIIDIAKKDIKSIMTPRLNVIAIKESASFQELKKIILGKKLSKIPVYRDNLDNITGIIHVGDILSALLGDQREESIAPAKIARRPIFLSEYSPLNFALKEFKKHRLYMAVIVDEYGSTIGILTLNDIFREIMGEIERGRMAITKTGTQSYIVKGDTPVDEVNEKLHLDLPEKNDYTTMSGLFVYHFGKMPGENNMITINDVRLIVKQMGRRKIEEIRMIRVPAGEPGGLS